MDLSSGFSKGQFESAEFFLLYEYVKFVNLHEIFLDRRKLALRMTISVQKARQRELVINLRQPRFTPLVMWKEAEGHIKGKAWAEIPKLLLWIA